MVDATTIFGLNNTAYKNGKTKNWNRGKKLKQTKQTKMFGDSNKIT